MTMPDARGDHNASLQPRLQRLFAGSGRRLLDLTVIEGGRSSLTLVATVSEERDTRDLVVKVAPAGLPARGNRDVLRQSRMLRALAAGPVPVPQVILEDPGSAAEPPLFAMERVAGECFEPVSDPHVPGDLETAPARAADAAALLARLHRVPASEFLMEEPRSLTDELDRWSRAMATADPVLVRGYESCAELLATTMPPPQPAVVVHGDWRLGNMVCAADRVAAVIDWEIWSVGDPRLDLAWFLMTTVADGNPLAQRRVPGYPTAAELLAAYEVESGRRRPPGLTWFRALARFKGAATMSLNVKYNRRRAVPDPITEQRAPLCAVLLEDCARLLAQPDG
jgi:aminoglycoside phosphotransferase (APT) family kinase protein